MPLSSSAKKELLHRLNAWRTDCARREGVDVFRVISNETLANIIEAMPKSRDEFLAIKGIKEKKYARYGADMKAIIDEVLGAKEEAPEKNIRTVTEYLDVLNSAMLRTPAIVRGEVTSLDIRGNYLFFRLKDGGESILPCFMWKRNYDISGVDLAEGTEIVVRGMPEIYKQRGSFTVRVDTVELVGEGQLKRAYEALKKKLADEGIFEDSRKRAIPDFPEKIGLITSSTGAVIHDFLNNIGRHGFIIKFMDSRVEGQYAVMDLVAAIKSMRDIHMDALVLIRGGGSLESLLPFNNEGVVREIARFPVPVICGIGHDKDVPLAALAADCSVSTPTAVTRVLNDSWEAGAGAMKLAEQELFHGYRSSLSSVSHGIRRSAEEIGSRLRRMLEIIHSAENSVDTSFLVLKRSIGERKTELLKATGSIVRAFERSWRSTFLAIENAESALSLNDPKRALRLGYGIIRREGKIIRGIGGVAKGSILDIETADGTIVSEVKKIQKNEKEQ